MHTFYASRCEANESRSVAAATTNGPRDMLEESKNGCRCCGPTRPRGETCVLFRLELRAPDRPSSGICKVVKMPSQTCSFDLYTATGPPSVCKTPARGMLPRATRGRPFLVCTYNLCTKSGAATVCGTDETNDMTTLRAWATQSDGRTKPSCDMACPESCHHWATCGERR